MAEQGMFIERLDGQLVNISFIQTVFIDPEDNTDVIWFMKNGETYREDLVTAEEAENRYNDVKELLLGTNIAELEKRIREQQQIIAEQAQELEDINLDIDTALNTAITINGEEV